MIIIKGVCVCEGGGVGIMSGNVDCDPLADLYNTDLLDALLGPGKKERDDGICNGPLSASSHLFMIGDSPFLRRSGDAAVARFCRRRQRCALPSWLDYGSIYCPFTKQFVSLRSPHWANLVTAGFGIDTRLRYGRRVALVRPRRLHMLALELQGGYTTTNHSKKKKEAGPLASWSSLLRQSLGVLLETTPADDEGAMVRRVLEVLSEENCDRACRRIPLSFYDHAGGERRIFDWTACDRRGKPYNDKCAFIKRLMSFGDSYLRQCMQWRTFVLQWKKKVGKSCTGIGFSMKLSPALYTTFSLNDKANNLINRHSSLNAFSFLVPNSRLAYLSVSHVSGASLLETALTAVLRTRLFEEFFYCPLEHCIDYSSLMDVKAYGMRWDMNGNAVFADEKEAIPLLHLGMHVDLIRDISTRSTTFVIIGNAHFLSKRAVARLVNQWTRNGSVQRAMHQDSKTDWKKKRELLFSFSDPLRVLDLGLSFFGNVHALFVGYSFSKEQHDFAVDKQNVVAQIQCGNTSVNIFEPTLKTMFYFEEPLVAAMQRISSCFQMRMNRSEQQTLIEELCDATSRCIVSSTKWEHYFGQKRDFISNNSSSGHCKMEEEEEEEFLLQLREAYEAFLTQPCSGDAVSILFYEKLLLRYPKFATMRVRHELLREYPLGIKVGEDSTEFFSQVLKGSSTDLSAKHPTFATERHITVVENRHLALKHAEEDHAALKKAYLISATPHRLTPSFGQCPLMHEQRYDPIFEPPVLLGRWTHTLLFCAPTAADVLLLRHLLYCDLTLTAKQTDSFVVLDLDIFHIDFVLYPSVRRCRLFGIRLRFDTNAMAGTDCSVRLEATRALQNALAKSAVEARLFPFWTHSTTVQRQQKGSSKVISHKSEVEGHCSFVANFCFEELDEYLTPAQPNIVERRMFALAMAQHGPLLLTVGSKAVALESISPHIPRGTWCRVVGFVPFDRVWVDWRTRCDADVSAQAPRRSSADVLTAQRYFEQQRGCTLLPVVQPAAGADVDGDVTAVVLPAATLVGGYRSLHHYALPTLQIPLLAPCQFAAASLLFHPLFSHEDSLMEFAPLQTRAEAEAMILQRRQLQSTDFFPGFDSCVSDEDGMFVEQNALEMGCNGKQKAVYKDMKTSPTLRCDVLSALSLFPLTKQ